MRLSRPLDDLFRGPSYVRVLRTLDELPDGLAVSAREVARRSGLSHPTASKVLASLAMQGVVLRRVRPRADAFELNRRHLFAEKLSPLFEWERGLRGDFLSFLRKELTDNGAGVSAAYLFGSFARGEMTAGSDMDLAIVCPRAKLDEIEAQMGRIAEAVGERFGNRLSLVMVGLSPSEQPRERVGHRLWARILKEGIPLLDRENPAVDRMKKQLADG